MDQESAERLRERLGHRWRVRASTVEEPALATVEVGPAEGDLAALLRAVRLWLVDSALETVRFSVDGRVELLESGIRIRRAA